MFGPAVVPVLLVANLALDIAINAEQGTRPKVRQNRPPGQIEGG